MFVEFTVGNYRSIRDEVTLSLIASRQKSRNGVLDNDNIAVVDKSLSLLRSAAIYGANASGKSNIVKAMGFFKHFVHNSAREGQTDDPIDAEPFALSTTTRDAPSHFEIVFILGGQQFRYGFEATSERVTKEWLFRTATTREVLLFFREGQEIEIHGQSFREGKGIESKTRPNALFLSVVAQFNGEIAQDVIQYLHQRCYTVTGLKDEGLMPFTLSCLQEGGAHASRIIDLVQRLDVGILGLTVRTQRAKSQLPSEDDKDVPESLLEEAIERMRRSEGARIRKDKEGFPFVSLLSEHKVRDADGHTIRTDAFPIEQMESEGTRKLVAFAGPLLDVLADGSVLWIDEMDARLHPNMTRAIIRLFNSTDTNSNNAQLIFVTHDTNLLDPRLLRRDQIWFTEKDESENTRLYSLAEFTAVRNDASYEKDYIQGRYGAVPYLGDLVSLFETAADETVNPEERDVSHAALAAK